MSIVRVKLAAGTDVGLVRQNNEDNFVVNGDLQKESWIIPQSSTPIALGKWGSLLVVADGMGGTNAGEVASAIAIETIQQKFAPDELEQLFQEKESPSEKTVCEFMTNAIKAADLNIVNRSKTDSSTQGMGTTIVILWIIEEKAYISWCGDSRCYVFNAESGICRLSKDHSYVQELVDAGKLDPENAIDHPYSNIITRCLGDKENRANPDFRSYEFRNGDIFLLCSDGLCGLCTDDEIMQVMADQKDSLSDCKNALIEAALSVGGYDNVTVGLCQVVVEEVAESKDLGNTLFNKPVKKHHSSFFLLFLIVLAVIILCLVYQVEITSIINTYWEGLKTDTTVVVKDTMNLNDGL